MNKAIKDILLSNRIFTYNNLIFSQLQEYDCLATEVWSTASGYDRFKHIELYKCNLARQDIRDLYNQNNDRFKKILWTRDVMSATSLVGSGICLAIEFSAPAAFITYILILFSFAAAIHMYMSYSSNLDINNIRDFPLKAEKVYIADKQSPPARCPHCPKDV